MVSVRVEWEIRSGMVVMDGKLTRECEQLRGVG
jgi:hypothetical protein